ncbi:MAG: kelch repeat-containing protein, partial [Acidimicrobiales bacterium]
RTRTDLATTDVPGSVSTNVAPSAEAPPPTIGPVTLPTVASEAPTPSAPSTPPTSQPVVEAIQPATGPSSGGMAVVLSGSGLDGATAVSFGGAEGSPPVAGPGPGQITALSPQHPEGEVDVSVTTPGGVIGIGRYTYVNGEGTWQRLDAPPRFLHSATLLANGQVLVAGGCTEAVDPLAEIPRPPGSEPLVSETCMNATDEASVFDPSTGSWRLTGKMGTARASHTATMLPNGKVLVAGGCTELQRVVGCAATPTDSAEVYDPAKGTWSPTGSMVTTHLGHTATLLPTGPADVCGKGCGKVLVVGRVLAGQKAPVDGAAGNGSAELYDTATGTWSSTASGRPRNGHTATLLRNGDVLFAGGFERDPSEVYSPALGAWRTVTSEQPIPRAYHTATLLQDGRVLITGGQRNGIDSSTELYDPEAVPDPNQPEVKGAWSAARRLTVGRFAHSATLLQDGRVLVAGGSTVRPADQTSLRPSGVIFPATAEIYDAASGRWSLATSMETGRAGSRDLKSFSQRGFTLTTLKDGRVLAAGGVEAPPRAGGLAPVSSAEIYTPAGLKPGSTKPAVENKSDFRWDLLGAGLVAAALAVAIILWQRRRRARAEPSQGGLRR